MGRYQKRHKFPLINSLKGNLAPHRRGSPEKLSRSLLIDPLPV